ncbi:XRE family transcriptional regulator [Kiloniella laminariae]|uniref:XRE family transcriptional regulator n=1 Tax=Kiloniella laminariae TaxID=454162 RepID=A0ABT4LJ38_9PROT|nr:XRE family transcriptional regulator [Kiloniella laminariae]MCZ4281124.1 XRE family transcriptional regulator [Kiloniella laminariae]
MPTKRKSVPQIGDRIRDLRKEKSLTLDQLAALSGVSKSMLSQIERGQANPTFATLWNLTQSFGMDIHELLEGTPRGPEPDVVRIELVPGNLTPTMTSPDGSCVMRILSPVENAAVCEWYELRFEPGGVLRSAPHARGTREHLTVLAGSITVESAGARDSVITGGTARYPADCDHALINPGDCEALALLVVERLQGVQ